MSIGTKIAMFFVLVVVQLASASNAYSESQSLLGRGYSPHFNTIESSLVAVDDKLPALEGAAASAEFGLVANSEHLERAISADASVSAAGTGWGASASSSLRKSYLADRRQVSFAATTQVIRGTAYLKSPIKIEKEAVELLNSDTARFLRAYGTSVVDSVSYGGAAVLLFTFNFATAEEAMEFSLSASGNYGVAKGNINVSLRELIRRSSNNVSVSGFVTGTNDLPEFFGGELAKDANNRATFYSAQFSEDILNQILSYLDTFPQKIKDAPQSALSQVRFSSRNIQLIESTGSLTPPVKDVLERAVELGDQLNEDQQMVWELRDKLWLMKTIYASYNVESNLALADDRLSELDVIEKKIEKRRNDLRVKSDFDSPIRFVKRDVKVLPDTFCTSDPTSSQSAILRGAQGSCCNNPKLPRIKSRAYWDYLIKPVDPSVTYTVVGYASHDHSRTDPGCNNGILEVRTNSIEKSQVYDSEKQETWVAKKDMSVLSEEKIVRQPPPFKSCRKQGASSLSTEKYSFRSEDVHGVRVLYTNWDDPGYNSTYVTVYKCGQ